MEKKKIKPSLIITDIILYIENPKSTKKQLELIYEFSKVTGHKVNIQIINCVYAR